MKRVQVVAVLIGMMFLLAVNVATAASSNKRVLMFVAYNDVWWAEYKVAYEALRAQGYTVDVVSSATGTAHIYGHNVEMSANQLSSYANFTSTFEANFGTAWDASWNVPQAIALDGRVQDIADMSNYDALVMPGGTGMEHYFYDGSYSTFGAADHEASAADVQSAAEKLNELINDALASGKMVGAQCHGGNLPMFARVPGSVGSGFDGMGVSVLAGHSGTSLTDTGYANLGVTWRSGEKVVVDGPTSAEYNGIDARDLIVTTRDWYPQTVSHFTRTMLNMIESYPTPAERSASYSVLVYGGGEPNHYSEPGPAYYDDIAGLLADTGDDFNFTVTTTNQTSALTVENLSNYDVLVYSRHTDISQSAEDAIATFVDNGGGLVGIHHAIWNPSGNNATLIDLFGGELPPVGYDLRYWGEENHLINVNLGEFVSAHGVDWSADHASSTEYSSPLGIPNLNDDNSGGTGYYHITIPANDELYLGARFNSNASFGRGVGSINRLLSNDHFQAGSSNPNNGHYDTGGWTKTFDGSDDGSIGRIVYLQPGETMERTFAHPSYLQMVKNAVLWTAVGETTATPTAVQLSNLDTTEQVVVLWEIALILLVVTALAVSLRRGD